VKIELGISDVRGVPLKIGTPIKFGMESECYGHIKSLIYKYDSVYHVFDMDSSVCPDGKFYKNVASSWAEHVSLYQLTAISEEEYVQGIMES
jgi:hypothetical protein